MFVALCVPSAGAMHTCEKTRLCYWRNSHHHIFILFFLFTTAYFYGLFYPFLFIFISSYRDIFAFVLLCVGTDRSFNTAQDSFQLAMLLPGPLKRCGYRFVPTDAIALGYLVSLLKLKILLTAVSTMLAQGESLARRAGRGE